MTQYPNKRIIKLVQAEKHIQCAIQDLDTATGKLNLHRHNLYDAIKLLVKAESLISHERNLIET